MALAGFIGFLLGAGTVSAYFLVFREQPSDIYERLVLEHLTAEESCSQAVATSPDPRGNLAADGVLAEALCIPTDEGGIKARFYLIHSTLGMQTTFYDILVDNNVQSTPLQPQSSLRFTKMRVFRFPTSVEGSTQAAGNRRVWRTHGSAILILGARRISK